MNTLLLKISLSFFSSIFFFTSFFNPNLDQKMKNKNLQSFPIEAVTSLNTGCAKAIKLRNLQRGKYVYETEKTEQKEHWFYFRAESSTLLLHFLPQDLSSSDVEIIEFKKGDCDLKFMKTLATGQMRKEERISIQQADLLEVNKKYFIKISTNSSFTLNILNTDRRVKKPSNFASNKMKLQNSPYAEEINTKTNYPRPQLAKSNIPTNKYPNNIEKLKRYIQSIEDKMATAGANSEHQKLLNELNEKLVQLQNKK